MVGNKTAMIQSVAENSRPFFGLSDDDKLTLINHSENMTYRVDCSNGETVVVTITPSRDAVKQWVCEA